jgi:site-specific DNA recombinase
MQSAKRCALYLRSSKDRHDVSIDAQRRELLELARAKGLEVAEEFADVVVSGATENRPGWQRLLLELRSSSRTWSTIIALDSSRIARNQFIAHSLVHECKKLDVVLLFAKAPELDGIAAIIVPAVLFAMDEAHSMLSREKGLAGMAENVRRGHRAGGRAPIGYRLERQATGAMRDGAAVTKSRLAPSDQAPAIAAYLKARAAGEARAGAARAAGLKLEQSSLIGVERNALTYAGHTTWNKLTQRTTHAALITDEEAERILAGVKQRAPQRDRGGDYLLSGILVAPDGRRWHGDGDGSYRCGRRRVSAQALERALLEKIAADLTNDDFVRKLLERARRDARPAKREAELRELQRQIRELERKAGRIRSAISQMQHPEGMIRELDKVEAERLELERQAADQVDVVAGDRVLLMITEQHVREVLAGMIGELEHDREAAKRALRMLLERVTLDERLTCRIHYAIPVVTGDKLASPREGKLIPGNGALLRARSPLVLVQQGHRNLPRRSYPPRAPGGRFQKAA